MLSTADRPLFATPITLTGPFREPAQMLAAQTYAGHKSVHDDESAAKLGLRGAPIEGPTHFSQFEPLAVALWGNRWFEQGCISAHFQNMVIDGEQVQARVTVAGDAVEVAQIDAAKPDGTPVLTGTISVGRNCETELDRRLATAIARPTEALYIVDQLSIGQVGANPETAKIEFDDHLGNLYPFTLKDKLASITERLSVHQPEATTPWGGPVLPFEMLSVFTHATNDASGFKVRQPSVGLFIDLEVRMLNGPVMVGKPYRFERKVVALGASKRTESFWTRTTLLDDSGPVCEVLLHQGIFKDSYADYPKAQ